LDVIKPLSLSLSFPRKHYVDPLFRTFYLACVAVSPEVRKAGTGDAMLGYQLRKAMNLGVDKVFALSTVTMDWFKERGFAPASLRDLPPSKAATYNVQRKSKIMIKSLADKRVVDEQELLLNI
jgi:N-acetylglutamate synthase-like GNAT family acetyltransferase